MKLGILGGGQLGRMLALAGYPLGLRFRALDPKESVPVGDVSEHTCAAYDDRRTLATFAQDLDAITYEFENVPVETARFLQERVPVYPPPEALEAAQDRLIEKTFFRNQNIPTAEFMAVDTESDLKQAREQMALPAVLKTRRMGYDGKGQVVMYHPRDVDPAWQQLSGVPLIWEEFVPFEREVSILAVRGQAGEMAFYPLVENHHAQGILSKSFAPAPAVSPELQQQAEEHARRVMAALSYVGVLAIEFFQKDGRLLANEMAPRVHNSGHWSIEGTHTSQFENHIRAVAGLPLGQTETIGHSAMINLIGTIPDTPALLALPNVHLHLYDKEPRPGRKLGHVTIWSLDRAQFEELLPKVEALLEGA